MCDCYTEKCSGCGAEAPVHIGDFSVDRRHVQMFCPNCHQDMLEEINDGWFKEKILMTDVDKSGRTYIFLIERPRSIHLNQ